VIVLFAVGVGSRFGNKDAIPIWV